jgi:hypothetical protein
VKPGKILVLGLCLGLPSAVFADFQYTETTKVTGGSVVSMMKLAGKFSKQARQANEPMTSTVLVKGNRMAHINRDSTEIVDLDRETITHIDNNKRQYSVLSFQQMKQKMEQAAKQMGQKDSKADVKFKASVRNTGATKQVAGLVTKESILTLSIEGKDKESGQSGSMDFTNDMWMASDVPGYAEVRDFELRYAEKLGFMTSGGLGSIMKMQAGMGQGMGEMVKEMSKLKGVPVLQIMRVGSMPNGQPLPAASEAPLPASKDPEMPSAGEAAQEGAASALTSRLGSLGGLGSGLGGFGRKKKEQPKEQQTSKQAPQGGAVVFMESSTELASFSSGSVDASRFEVPAGYKQVQEK